MVNTHSHMYKVLGSMYAYMGFRAVCMRIGSLGVVCMRVGDLRVVCMRMEILRVVCMRMGVLGLCMYSCMHVSCVREARRCLRDIDEKEKRKGERGKGRGPRGTRTYREVY